MSPEFGPGGVDVAQAGRIAAPEAPKVYEAPSYWTPEHVDVRITEAFEILLTIPTRNGPAPIKSVMPAFAYTREDLEGQAEMIADVTRAQKRLTRARGSATGAEITRMEDALGWPLRFLKDDSDLARAVAWSCFRKAVKREDAKLHLKLGVSRRTFFRYRLRGLQTICDGLKSSGRPCS